MDRGVGGGTWPRYDIAITLDTYSHVLPTMQESAAAAMEDALA